MEITFRALSSVQTVVVKDGTGNISCGADISLDNREDMTTFVYDSSLSLWLLKAFESNGA
jgi:hypothetical protein